MITDIAARRTTAQIVLDRTGVRRVAKAALLLIERAGSREAATELVGCRTTTLGELARMRQPWRVNAGVLARIEQALGLPEGAVLRGEEPA